MHSLRQLFLIGGVSLALLGFVASASRAGQQPTGYQAVMESVRVAKQKIAADSRDIYPLLAIIQGSEYPNAIQAASRRGDDAALRELYQAKYSKQWPRTVKGTPVLFYAAMNGDTDVVRRLLARGADATAANEEGWTALHAAAERSSSDIVKLLLAHKAKADAKTARFGETPLMLACGQFGGTDVRSLACTRLLIAHGADIDARTNDGETPLMFAARRGMVDTVKLLLSKNANTAHTDFKGKTALSQVEDFTRIDTDGKITYTQDSTSVPVYKLTVFEALIQHGKVNPGRYASVEVERKVQTDALKDFLTIARLLK